MGDAEKLSTGLNKTERNEEWPRWLKVVIAIGAIGIGAIGIGAHNHFNDSKQDHNNEYSIGYENSEFTLSEDVSEGDFEEIRDVILKHLQENNGKEMSLSPGEYEEVKNFVHFKPKNKITVNGKDFTVLSLLSLEKVNPELLAKYINNLKEELGYELGDIIVVDPETNRAFIPLKEGHYRGVLKKEFKGDGLTIHSEEPPQGSDD